MSGKNRFLPAETQPWPKVSHKEQHYAIHFLWPKGLSVNAIDTEMNPVTVTMVLWDQQYVFGVRSLLIIKKVLKNDLAMQPAVISQQHFYQAFTSLLIDGINVWMNMEDMLKNINVTVWHFKRYEHVYFCVTCNIVLHLASYERILVGKIPH